MVRVFLRKLFVSMCVVMCGLCFVFVLVSCGLWNVVCVVSCLFIPDIACVFV